MDDKWLVLLIIISVILFIIGNFSTVHKTSNKPLRKKGLNDLKETLPRKDKNESRKNHQSYTKTANSFIADKEKSSD
ncbi:hypothetical protein [Thalassotalea algicola]|uniref:hypothetical protein n=1 Tax=Thalassotalea algicola TaxID=2716224 RepID=UPI00145FBDD2|nr:hypothetical protein [Thalassotalea algicola]